MCSVANLQRVDGAALCERLSSGSVNVSMFVLKHTYRTTKGANCDACSVYLYSFAQMRERYRPEV